MWVEYSIYDIKNAEYLLHVFRYAKYFIILCKHIVYVRSQLYLFPSPSPQQEVTENDPARYTKIKGTLLILYLQ